ncbi:MAG: carboxyl transferase domain-containing protein [Trebonia sp.]|jgi:acetyl/propionyl-CoA carboxylase alpha subunit/acetyl-CoA carboxylase carboxyltransferase component
MSMDGLGTLLVAARGEIAVRIMATAAVLGLRTVAVYPDDDADCAHVARADVSVRLPGAGAAAYLDLPAVLAAARQAGAGAVHPGYGFLSENPELARACARDGLIFVGPSADALELFGDKTRARERATALGIDVPGGTGVLTDDDDALVFAASLPPGAPLMVKARAGGGGRGMRPVRTGDDLGEALRRGRSEAAAAFGDDGVFVEELLTSLRHIEVQVIGDGERVQVLGDRDCSLQRRRQKLLEIGPALDLDGKTRQLLHDAARRLVGSVPYRGLATVEFLVGPDRVAFLEVNPRLQVEHTVTEQVTGLDLVELALAVASGGTLSDLGLDAGPAARGVAMQARVNAETLRPDGSVAASGGTLARFQPPSGPGIRVDTLGYAGYRLNPRYDSLLAKVIASGTDASVARSRLARALAEFDIEGAATNIGVLRALAARPELGTAVISTDWLDGHLGELDGDDGTLLSPDREEPPTPVPGEGGEDVVLAPMPGTVLALSAAAGQTVAQGTEVAVLESMKMEHVVTAPVSGTLAGWHVEPGDVVDEGAVLAVIIGGGQPAGTDVEAAEADPDHLRPDLAETLDRHRIGRDDARPAAVGKRHAAGRLTARETVAALVDLDSFVEYGALAIAAQRRRRSLADLIAGTPADGMITGTATISGAPVAVLCYDYTVLAGTQGLRNHQKADRIYRLALAGRLPLVLFAEGGGGRPGDTDTASVAHLDVSTFRLAAQLSGTVPTVAVVSGYCFAGNAALASVCDLIVATEGSSLGMGGPAMIEGGGLGVVAPGDVGPMSVQARNGVVDVVVPDDESAVAIARHYVSLFAAARPETPTADQRRLRNLVPESRTRAYDVRPIIETLADEGSLLELRAGFGAGIVTALARLGGRPAGIMANNPRHLGGAIDGDAADKATRFLELCRARSLPLVSLCDTPGFMVGPAAERTATVRRFGDMFVAGARLGTPMCTVVLRKAYGLGAMAMAGGDLRAPVLTVAWPTAELGPMGLEGAVRLGYQRELRAIADPADRQRRYQELVAEQYENGKALSAAATFEIDDVIDPAATRALLLAALSRGTAAPRSV